MREGRVARPDILAYEQGRQSERKVCPKIECRVVNPKDLPKEIEALIQQAKTEERARISEEIEKGLLTNEELFEAENQFIEKAKAKHKELGHKFISGEITYDEYGKQSMEAWAGYYRVIAQAQLQKILGMFK